MDKVRLFTVISLGGIFLFLCIDVIKDILIKTWVGTTPEISLLRMAVLVIPLSFLAYTTLYKPKYVLISLFFLGVFLYWYSHPVAFSLIDTDSWSYLRYIRDASQSMPPPPFDPEGFTDPHYGPQMLLGGYLYKYAHLSERTILHIFSLSTFGLLLSSLYLFGKEKYNPRVGIYLVITSFFLWGVYELGFRSSAIPEVWYFFSVDMFSVAMLFFALFFYIKNSTKYFIGSVVFGVLCFTNHLVTGVILLVIVFCLSLESLLTDKKIHPAKCVLFFFVVGGLTFLWPGYDLLYTIDVVKEVAVPEKSSLGILSQMYYSLSFLVRSLGVAFMGLPFLVFSLKKRENLFVPLLFAVCFVYFLAGLPYYRRFVVPIALSLHLSLALFFDTYPVLQYRRTFCAVLIFVVCFFAVSRPGITGFTYVESKIPLDVTFLNEVIDEKDSKILSDLMTEYLIRTQTDFKIQSSTRVIPHPEIKHFFGSATAEERIQMITQNSIDYILLNKRIITHYSEVAESLSDVSNPVYEDDVCVLLEVNLD
jgi:hypothetical protein